MALLEVDRLSIGITRRHGTIPVVDEVSFTLDRGEVLGVIGESGSGKSLTAKAVARLNPESSVCYPSGRITFDGLDVLAASREQLRAIRGPGISMIFQDPVAGFNPVLSVGEQIGEAAREADGLTRAEADRRVATALGDVGIPMPERRARQYPHEFSGGMLQRAMIAMALIRRPSVLVADEATTALDVTVQGEVLDLILDMRKRFDMGVLFITHDMGVVAKVADRVMVMYAGRAVETGLTHDIFSDPLMPYTRDLLDSIPTADKTLETLAAIPGRPPIPSRRPTGCRYNPRCAAVMPVCREIEPALVGHSSGHSAACHCHDAGVVRIPERTGLRFVDAGG
jgi:oligopeptide/dipeptide ABC transporter ATP-binding protein